VQLQQQQQQCEPLQLLPRLTDAALFTLMSAGGNKKPTTPRIAAQKL